MRYKNLNFLKFFSETENAIRNPANDRSRKGQALGLLYSCRWTRKIRGLFNKFINKHETMAKNCGVK